MRYRPVVSATHGSRRRQPLDAMESAIGLVDPLLVIILLFLASYLSAILLLPSVLAVGFSARSFRTTIASAYRALGSVLLFSHFLFYFSSFPCVLPPLNCNKIPSRENHGGRHGQSLPDDGGAGE